MSEITGYGEYVQLYKKLPKSFAKSWTILHFSLAMFKSSSCSASSQAVGIVNWKKKKVSLTSRLFNT